MIAKADAMHAALVHVQMPSPAALEGDEEVEVSAIAEVLEAYEAKRWRIERRRAEGVAIALNRER